MYKVNNAKEIFSRIKKDNINNKNIVYICEFVEKTLKDVTDAKELEQAILDMQLFLRSKDAKRLKSEIIKQVNDILLELKRFPIIIDEYFPKEFSEEFREHMKTIGYNPLYENFDMDENQNVLLATKWWTKHIIGSKKDKENFAFDLAVYIYNIIKNDGICDLNAYSNFNYMNFLLKKYNLRLDFEKGIHVMIITDNQIFYRDMSGSEQKLLWTKENQNKQSQEKEEPKEEYILNIQELEEMLNKIR